MKKTGILTLFVLLAISQCETLRCYCGGQRYCPNSMETCLGTNNVCARVIFYSTSNPSFFKGCLKLYQCMLLNYPDISSAACCKTDLCND